MAVEARVAPQSLDDAPSRREVVVGQRGGDGAVEVRRAQRDVLVVERREQAAERPRDDAARHRRQQVVREAAVAQARVAAVVGVVGEGRSRAQDHERVAVGRRRGRVRPTITTQIKVETVGRERRRGAARRSATGAPVSSGSTIAPDSPTLCLEI